MGSTLGDLSFPLARRSVAPFAELSRFRLRDCLPYKEKSAGSDGACSCDISQVEAGIRRGFFPTIPSAWRNRLANSSNTGNSSLRSTCAKCRLGLTTLHPYKRLLRGFDTYCFRRGRKNQVPNPEVLISRSCPDRLDVYTTDDRATARHY